MSANLPIQRHPFDEAGKVFVNKEWYLALLGLVKSSTPTPGPSVDDVSLLEALDADSETEQISKRLRQIELLIALMPDYQEPVLSLVDELGSGGTPGFAAGVDFTAGTTTALNLSRDYKTAAALWVAFDGTLQGADQFSLSGKVLTFTSPIPVGTGKVFVKGFIKA